MEGISVIHVHHRFWVYHYSTTFVEFVITLGTYSMYIIRGYEMNALRRDLTSLEAKKPGLVFFFY